MAGGDSLVAHPRGMSASERYVRRDTRPALSPSLCRPGRRAPRPVRPGCTGGAAGYGTVEACATGPRRAPIPDAPGSYQFLDAGRPGPLRGQGQVAAQPAVQLLRRPGHPAGPDGPDGGRGRPGRVDPGRQRRRGHHARVRPHQAAPAPLQHPAGRRQELPVAGRHPARRLAPGRGGAGPAPARASATSAPTPTPAPSATPSTCCCGPSRSGPAPTPSSTATSSWASPACCSTSSGARALHRGRGPRALRRLWSRT